MQQYVPSVFSRRRPVWVLTIVLLMGAMEQALAYPPLGMDQRLTVTLARSTAVADAAALLQQGRTFYEAGQFKRAVEVFRQAAEQFQANGDDVRQAMALGNLSLVHQQLGQWAEAERTIGAGLGLLEPERAVDAPRSQILAQLLDIKGRLDLDRGQPQSALLTWQQAAQLYRTDGAPQKWVQNQINQAQAQQALGQYRQARLTLLAARDTLARQPHSSLKALGLRSLGNVFRVVGDLKLSEQVLLESLTISTELSVAEEQVRTRLSLGHTRQAQGQSAQALALYQDAVRLTDSLALRTQAQLHGLALYINTQAFEQAAQLWPTLVAQIEQLPPGRTSMNARIFLGETLVQWHDQARPLEQPSTHARVWQGAQLLATAVQQAQDLGDPRGHSLALGTLGHLYEQHQQWTDATTVTQQALFLAQSLNMPDLSYQWQWQLGRLQQRQGQPERAIASYTDAVRNLDSIQRDLATINPEVQFSFQTKVEPVYRELLELLLSNPTGSPPTQARLQQARSVLESLKVAELENYFRSACVDTTASVDQIVDQPASNAAVLYPVILHNRLALIVKLPRQAELAFFSTPVTQSTVDDTLQQLQVSLPNITRTAQVKRLSSQVYDWLIRPLEPTLATNGIDTLTFALDGALRNVPMAVLYDQTADAYLVEKYAIALIPSLRVLPQPRLDSPLNVLAAGIDEQRVLEGREFAPLTNVSDELGQISAELSNSRNLINQGFTVENLSGSLRSRPFTIVHIATHGEFSSSPENTYLLTWDRLLKGNEFATLLQQRAQDQTIELLVLSACQTAVGDDRAALGLAGIAVQAGAQSTLATLWSIDDQSTSDLMGQFYQALEAGQSKSEALRTAQLAILAQDQRPYFWAPYVLVGNWL